MKRSHKLPVTATTLIRGYFQARLRITRRISREARISVELDSERVCV